jgi:xanthine dehydrogenase accessory factor
MGAGTVQSEPRAHVPPYDGMLQAPMDNLFSDIVRLHEAGSPFALGTVIHTAGSTPQKAGARAVFLPGGQLLGTLGGGCMEAEARRRGLQLVAGGAPELLELHLDDDFGWDDGLICGGTAQIFLQPAPTDAGLYAAALELRAARGRGVFGLVTQGPSDWVGRAFLYRDGALVGDWPDEALRRAIGAAAAAALEEGREDPRRTVLRDPDLTLYLEPLLPKPVCLIAGAGHIGAALCHYAARCGFEVAIVDDRASLCNAERLPDASHVLVGDIVETVRNWPKTPESYFVVVTRGHRHDAVVLRELVRAECAYLGMIGSKRKILTIYEEFLAEGLADPEDLARIHAPLGLDIGAVTVEEIALCIAAELVLARRKGKEQGRGRSYRDCAGGGRVASDGGAQAAIAARLEQRAADGRPLAEGLPRGRRAGGGGAPRG